MQVLRSMIETNSLTEDVVSLLSAYHKKRLLERRKYVREVLDAENKAQMKALMPREKETVVLL
jgi:hypothetical protein